ncbi:hypothetical protein LJR220_002033 [Bradyrhizobium sp. LjRoot220]|uniref:hypothetical protein n=1 Tax=Bradyrhizobium sp. LjRoot220 TaxID=3342284 RepID=UPI003ECF8E6B
MVGTAQERLAHPTKYGTTPIARAFYRYDGGDESMGRYLLLWLLGVPIPILVLIYAFGGLN